MNKPITFEYYLMLEFGKTYRGFDDDMPDDFQEWLSRLEPDEIMEFAEQALKTVQEDILSERLLL